MKFCSYSSIHGLRYIASESRQFVDRFVPEFLISRKKIKFFPIFSLIRIWWIVAFAFSLYLCASLINDLWMKWDETPVIISYSHHLDSIGTIPFPAMTICPLAKISVNKFNYTQAYRTFLKLDGNSTENITNDE